MVRRLARIDLLCWLLMLASGVSVATRQHLCLLACRCCTLLLHLYRSVAETLFTAPVTDTLAAFLFGCGV